MGRKTYESIGRPLPHRTNIVVSRDSSFLLPEGVFLVDSIDKALELAKEKEEKEVFVIGGAQLYGLALPFADKLYLTLVNKEVKDADAYFPDYSEFGKVLFERPSRDKNYSYMFVDLAR